MSKTFRLNLSFDVKAVVPQTVIDSLLQYSEGDEAPEYLKEIRKGATDEHGDLDLEVFVQSVLIANLRGKVRGYTVHMFTQAGLGGTVSPIRVTEVDVEDQ